jgi:thiamine-phosphate pyrophosphorylase
VTAPTVAAAATTGPPRLYLVTDRDATGGRSLPAVLDVALGAVQTGALAPGAVAVQLRDKDLNARDLLRLARELRAITAAHGVRLFVNGRIDVALAVGADGVHLGGGALPIDDVRAIGPGLQIAVSTHSGAEAMRWAADSRVCFVVLGPIFETPSKRAYGPPLGLEVLRTACATGARVIAIGGIDAARARECLAAGASGVAAIRAVLAASAPDRALTSFFGAIERT